MSYKPRYIMEMPTNPTTPGVVTTVEQLFDGTKLTDRYIKQLTKQLRTWGTLPRYGGMFQVTAMLAKHLGLGPPIGFYLCNWRDGIVVATDRYGEKADFPYAKEYFADFERVSQVRGEVKQATAGQQDPHPWVMPRTQEDIWTYGCGHFPGWTKHERELARSTLHEHALAQIPGYMESMERIATFLESRPRIVLAVKRELKCLTNQPNPKTAKVV